MDGLSWDASQLVENIPASWSNRQHDLQASFLMSSSNLATFSSTEELQKVQTSHACVDSSRVTRQMVELPATSNITSVVSDRLPLQPQEATRLAADEILFKKSGIGAGWGEVLASQSLTSLSTRTPHNVKHVNSFVLDLSKSQQPQVTGGEVLPATGSLDHSVDCLLSATNSNTDNYFEDDGISLILSDCRNFWSFGNYGSAVSSGESDSNACDLASKEMQLPVNELIETVVSQCSSDPFFNNSKQESKPYSIKRSSDQVETTVGADIDPCFNVLQKNYSNSEGGFRFIYENKPKSRKPSSEKSPSSSNINLHQASNTTTSSTTEEPDPEAIAQMKEMIYRAAAFRPVNLGLEVVEKPKRKNVRISTDPQTVAARQRRERISERIRVLQRLVPGGSKMDTASMLDEAANYLKFLRSQVKALESQGNKPDSLSCPPFSLAFSFNTSFPKQTHLPLQYPSHIRHPQG